MLFLEVFYGIAKSVYHTLHEAEFCQILMLEQTVNYITGQKKRSGIIEENLIFQIFLQTKEPVFALTGEHIIVVC